MPLQIYRVEACRPPPVYACAGVCHPRASVDRYSRLPLRAAGSASNHPLTERFGRPASANTHTTHAVCIPSKHCYACCIIHAAHEFNEHDILEPQCLWHDPAQTTFMQPPSICVDCVTGFEMMSEFIVPLACALLSAGAIPHSHAGRPGPPGLSISPVNTNGTMPARPSSAASASFWHCSAPGAACVLSNAVAASFFVRHHPRHLGFRIRLVIPRRVAALVMILVSGWS